MEVSKQIGNAVRPPLAQAVGTAVLAAIWPAAAVVQVAMPIDKLAA